MSGQILNCWLQLVDSGACIVCGISIALPSNYKEERLRDRKDFYCANGHAQHFIGKTEEQKLREQLAEKERLLAAERARATTNYVAREKAERALKKIKRRTSGGVCPCCNRTFTALTKHMNTKHPDFIKESR